MCVGAAGIKNAFIPADGWYTASRHEILGLWRSMIEFSCYIIYIYKKNCQQKYTEIELVKKKKKAMLIITQ